MINGIEVLVAGITLCKKKNRNEFEERAVKAFKRMMIVAVVPILLYAILICVVLVPDLARAMNGGAFIYSSYVKRMGHVEDGRVRYVQGENKYVSFEKLNISAENVQDGDEITLFFDTSTDELIFGKVTKGQDHQIGDAFVNLFASVIILIIFYLLIAAIGKKRWFADFNKWYATTSANR